ncbi:nucleotidyltransferase domain-containing protein [Paenibacillus glycanilyticus]|uniref:nucleotidyltransferase domain-containing protein n=1 Tax=Paenibacillus glycanilyticus TaxID=126569 RepID=UPI002042466F|nr:nucleotidyltransferase domain-containing protein [Paenibacillus glycanilyticus]MCM3628670.1 nucleotidyltransferase domain-containing protein [Paenibacillus glycanilyticus]
MLNVFEVAEALVNRITDKFPNEVAIIGYYGSYAQGTATKRSDLDFFFIPASPAGYRHSLQFIVSDICFDFWPISWERAERMAAFEELNVSIIADCKLLYVRSEEDRNRFMQLRQQIDAQSSKEGIEFIMKAEEQLRNAKHHLLAVNKSEMNGNDLSLFRLEAREFLVHILNGVSLLNRTYYTKGWGKNNEQIIAFAHKPEQLETLMRTIMRANSCKDIYVACNQLFENTNRLLNEQKEKYTNGFNYIDRMKGFYEEIKGIFDKILTACERDDYPSAYFWAIGVQIEVARALYYAEKGYWPADYDNTLDYMAVYTRLGLPDLAVLLDPAHMKPLFEAVQHLDALLEKHLIEQGVIINRFQDVDDFKQYLDSIPEE